MLDHSEENRTATMITIAVVIALMAVAFFGLSEKSNENGNCLAIGEELVQQGGRGAMPEKRYLELKQKIEAVCSKKVAQDFLVKANQ